MGLETFLFAFLSAEFKKSIKPANNALPVDGNNKAVHKSPDWSVIVEMTPFIKHMSIEFRTGHDFFVAKIKPVLEDYAVYGYRVQHLVYDNGSPSAKYATHVKRYTSGNDSPYPTTLQSVLENISLHTPYGIDFALQTGLDGSDPTDAEGRVTYVSTISDATMIKSDAWPKFLTNKDVVHDIVSYITNKIALSPQTRELALKAGVFSRESADDSDVFSRRTVVPPRNSEIRIYSGVLDHSPQASGDGKVPISLSRKDDGVLVVTTDGTIISNDTFSKNTVNRMQEGEMTCAMIAYDKIFKAIDDYVDSIKKGDMDVSVPAENCRILIDSVDGDLVVIAMYVYHYAMQYCRQACARAKLPKTHIDLAMPKIGVWLRKSGTFDKKNTTTTTATTNDIFRQEDASFDPMRPNLFVDERTVPVTFRNDETTKTDATDKFYSKMDWHESRSNASSFRASQFKDEDPRLRHKENKSNIIAKVSDAVIESDGVDRPHFPRSFSYDVKSSNTRESQSIRVNTLPYYRKPPLLSRQLPVANRFGGAYVDVNNMYKELYDHDVFRRTTDPVSTLMFIASLCGNDYIVNSVPGLASGSDKEKRPWFFLPFLYETIFNDMVKMTYEETDCEFGGDNESQGTLILTKVEISDVLFRNYIHTVYYYKYRDVKNIKIKAEALYAQRYAKRNYKIAFNKREAAEESLEETLRLKEETEKQCYIDVIKEHYTADRVKKPILTNAQISGLKARLVWYLEYTASAPLNRGYYPNPLLVVHGKSVYGWKSVPNGNGGGLAIQESNDVFVDAHRYPWYDDVSKNYSDVRIPPISSLKALNKQTIPQKNKDNNKNNNMSDVKLLKRLEKLDRLSSDDAGAMKKKKAAPTFADLFLKHSNTNTNIAIENTPTPNNSNLNTIALEQPSSAIDNLAFDLGLSLYDDDELMSDVIMQDSDSFLTPVVNNDDLPSIPMPTRLENEDVSIARQPNDANEGALKRKAGIMLSSSSSIESDDETISRKKAHLAESQHQETTKSKEEKKAEKINEETLDVVSNNNNKPTQRKNRAVPRRPSATSAKRGSNNNKRK